MITYEEQLVTNRLGRQYWIYKNDTFYHQRIANVGPYQGANLRRLRSLCPNARTVIDAGMNIGMNTVEYGTWAQTVHAFEPTPQTYNMAVRNIDMAKNQQLANDQGWFKQGEGYADLSIRASIHTYCLGLGSKPENKHIIVKPNNAGQNHIDNSDVKVSNRKGSATPAEKIDIEIRTLDSFEFKDVDIIKIDVEGFEYEVLMGAAKTIEQSCPVIQVEMIYGHANRFGRSLQDILDFFQQRDYQMTLNDGTVLPMEWNVRRPVKGKSDRIFIHRSHPGYTQNTLDGIIDY